MTQEEKSLLLKDLCARLPYGVKVDITYNKEHGSSDRLRICSEGCLILNADVLGLYIEDEIYLKPYLRPLSSMTEEEEKVLNKYGWVLYREEKESFIGAEDIEEPLDGGGYKTTYITNSKLYEIMNFLNSHHFDYNGWIEKCLALEAHEEMYNNKIKLTMATIKEIDEYCSLCMDINCTGCGYHDVHFRNVKKNWYDNN